MDSQTEHQFLRHLHGATQGQTLVMVTHRPSLLTLVDRVIVVDGGKVVLDGPKDTVLARLSGQPVAPTNVQQPAANSEVPTAANKTSVKPAAPVVTRRSTTVTDGKSDVEVSA